MLESYKDIADSLHLLSEWTVDDLCKESMYVRDICEEGSGIIKEMMEKLAAYEDAEDQGLLVRLPCKVGTPVWSSVLCRFDENDEEQPAQWPFVISMMDEWGTGFFLSRAEAEAALKGEMEDV